MNLNKVTLIGHLDSNPKSRALPTGAKLTTIVVVTAEHHSPLATDTEVMTAVNHTVVAYGRLGEIMSKYLKTGDRVYLEGRLQQFEDEHGKPVSEILATQLIMLGARSKADR